MKTLQNKSHTTDAVATSLSKVVIFRSLKKTLRRDLNLDKGASSVALDIPVFLKCLPHSDLNCLASKNTSAGSAKRQKTPLLNVNRFSLGSRLLEPNNLQPNNVLTKSKVKSRWKGNSIRPKIFKTILQVTCAAFLVWLGFLPSYILALVLRSYMVRDTPPELLWHCGGLGQLQPAMVASNRRKVTRLTPSWQPHPAPAPQHGASAQLLHCKSSWKKKKCY